MPIVFDVTVTYTDRPITAVSVYAWNKKMAGRNIKAALPFDYNFQYF